MRTDGAIADCPLQLVPLYKDEKPTGETIELDAVGPRGIYLRWEERPCNCAACGMDPAFAKRDSVVARYVLRTYRVTRGATITHEFALHYDGEED